MTCAILSGGCTELLLEGKDYHLDEGDEGDEGDGGSAGAGGQGDTACEDGLTTCDGACVRVASDALHCGACGHDCHGAACNAGMCATEVIVAQIPEPQAFALDDTHVYWTGDDGVVQRAPKAGGPVETIAAVQNDPGAIAVDAKRVYWINRGDGTLLKRKKDGNGNTKVVFDGGEAGGLASLTFDADSLYFNRKHKKGDIRRAKKETDDLPVILVKDQPDTAQIRVLGAGLVWSGFMGPGGAGNGWPEDPGKPRDGMGGYIRFMLRQGADAFVTLAEGEGEITALVAAGETAVWVDGASGRVRARGVGDSAPVTLAESAQIAGLAADDTQVYWATATGVVTSYTLGSGDTRALAFDVGAPGAIAVDGTHVYILRAGAGGGVLRVAR